MKKHLPTEVVAKARAMVSKPLPPRKPQATKLLTQSKRAKLIAALKRLHPMD